MVFPFHSKSVLCLVLKLSQCKFFELNVRNCPTSGSCKLSEAMLRCSWFFTIQRIWFVLGRCLFLRSVHTFSWFLKSNWSGDFGRICFALILKQSEKTAFEQKFGFSVVVFCSHAAISLWILLFCRFFGSFFFLNDYPNPFIILSRLSFFVWTKFHFLVVVFYSHVAFWHWFSVFYLIFFTIGFPN